MLFTSTELHAHSISHTRTQIEFFLSTSKAFVHFAETENVSSIKRPLSFYHLLSKMLKCEPNIKMDQTGTVRPDWAIYASFWRPRFLQKLPKNMLACWANSKNISFMSKLLWLLFGQLLAKFRLLLFVTFGHSESLKRIHLSKI